MMRTTRTTRTTSAARLGVLAALLAACGESRAPDEGDGPAVLGAVLPVGFAGGTLADTAPADNALTEERARLGRRLFFDPRLSSTGQVACATCHDPTRAFSDPAAVSTGVDGLVGTRNAPALVNLAWSPSLFWDGRSPSLEDQAGRPIEDPLEMNLPLAEAVARVAADDAYVGAFLHAYGGPPAVATLRFALASFVRALVSGDSPYDRHLRGDDARFSAGAARGEALFLSERAACFHCHPPGALTNGGFFNNGSADPTGDRGRQALTGRTGDRGKFRVPGLRNVAVSAPYMHDGALADLAAVIEHYDRGGDGDPNTDPQIQPLGLTPAEKDDLLAFLHALTDDRFLADPRFVDPQFVARR